MPKSALTGSRIREHRLMRGLKQAELARLSGISASYLNLIEHNRRRIGGKTLLTLSQVLGIDPSQLSQGAEQGVVSALQNAAAADVDADGAQTPVELDQIDDLVARFPGWAAKITAQHQRLQALEQQMDGLNDRLTHDPVLSEKMHEVLSTVAAIRSTASILVGNPDLDADWQSRFYSNIDTESRRLADSSATMAAHLDRLSRQEDGSVTPLEMIFAALDACGHHIAALESGGEVDAVLESWDLPQGRGMRGVARSYLEQYRRDAAQMPLAPFEASATVCAYDPSALAQAFDAPLPAVLRRLASLPRAPHRPDMGLVTVDAAGAILQRKSPTGLTLPRFGAGCPLWPLFSALSSPAAPVARQVQTDSGAQFKAYAVAYPAHPADFGAAPVLQATMLLVETPIGEGGQDVAHPIGAACRVCTRDSCTARREPSVLR